MSPDPLVGSTVGKYSIVRVIGSGGMGVLYEARHPILANRLAIKTLRPGLGGQGADRFRNEALIASRLRDDRLPQIFDIDQLEDGTHYIVMEYLEGEDLSHRLSRGALEPGYAARLVFEVLEVLGKMHNLGIVHRDVKPANIFIARSALFGEVPKLLDFGVAHMASATMTHAGQVLGTPAYMAPEQALDNGRIGPWTDVFSAAVVLFELIAGPGERPWVAKGAFGHINALAGSAPPRSLASLAPWTPPGLCDAIERALQRDPAERHQGSIEFARSIEAFAVDRSALYKPAPAVAASTRDEQAAQEATTRAGLHSALESPIVARKVADLRDAFARLLPAPSSRPGAPAPQDQLQSGERRLVVIASVRVQLQQAGDHVLPADDEEQLIAQFLDLLGRELAQQGAHVTTQPDAGLIGIFGSDRLREDDAERAVAAALGIGRRRGEASLLLAELGCTLTTRIGLHRGFVSRRSDEGSQPSLVGETIGLARRLSEGAPLNGIVGTVDVLDGLRDWLVLRPFARIKFPGRTRPVEAREVLGTTGTGWGSAAGGRPLANPAPAAQDGPADRPGASPFVGRDAAMEGLRHAFHEASAGTSLPTLVAVTGPPGMGKTRLDAEFFARQASEARHVSEVLWVQPPPRVSYGLWGSLLEKVLARVAALGPSGAGTDAAFAALVGALDGERSGQLRQQRAIVDLLTGSGVDDMAGASPQQTGDRIQVAVTLSIVAAARLLGRPTAPLVIALENLHWADSASVSLIPKVVPAIRADVAPILLFTMRGAPASDLLRAATVIQLGPLSEVEASALAVAGAGSTPLSPAVHQLVAQRCGGNPLFIEQMVAMLREEGLLGASEAQLRTLVPPVSLYGLLLERVDRLEPAIGGALRICAVLGVEFERDVYLAVHGQAAPGVDSAAALDELVARGFLAGTSSAGDMLAFEPAQLQAAVYGTILTENRQILHTLAAQAIERCRSQHLARHLARIRHHYSQSGNVERTVHYARLAGERALSMAAYDEATEHLATAVALQDKVAGVTDLAAAETLHLLAMSLEWRGQLRSAATRVEEAVARLGADPDRPPGDRPRTERLARLAMTNGELNGLLGDWDRAIACYAEAERRFTDIDLAVSAAEARCCRGFGHRARGQLEVGAALAREGWAVLGTTADPAVIARAGHELGNLLRDLKCHDEALGIFDRAVACGDQLRRAGRMSESTWGSLAARSGRGMTHAAMGNLVEAMTDQRAVVDLATRDGNRVAEAISCYHLAVHSFDLGDTRSADESAERAYRLSHEMDMPGRALKCRVVQARVRVREADWAGALERIEGGFAGADRGRLSDDGVVDAVDVIIAARDHVPAPVLTPVARTAWRHASAGTSDPIRARAAALAALLEIGHTENGDRASPLTHSSDDEATRGKCL
jgi:tetratricopeptide (TPR) repeat protein